MLDPLNLLISWATLRGILMFCWAAIHTVAKLYICCFLWTGISGGYGLPRLFAGTIPSLTKGLNKIGARVGVSLSMISLGSLTGPSVAGALIARGGYLAGQIWAGAALLVGVMALVGARVIISGPHLLAKL